jgi:hypothetical protein
LPDKLKRKQLEEHGSYYAIIPADVRYDKKLRANAKLLFGEITALCNKKGYCWASNGYFATLYDCSETAVSLWIKQLADNKYIKVVVDQAAGNTRIIRINTSRFEPELEFEKQIEAEIADVIHDNLIKEGIITEVDASLTNVNEGTHPLNTSLTNVNEGTQQNLDSSLTNLKHNNTINITENITNEVEEKKDLPVVSTYELLFNKKPLQAFYDGTCDKLAFDFYDIDLVNKNIERLFRMFVKDSQPIQIHIDRVRNELLNDPRPELPRKVCWVIIQMKFMQYPGTNKKYQDFESLMKRIRWDKDEFVQQLPQAQKFNEARLDRQKEKETDEQQRQEANVTALEWIEQKLLKYENVLTAKEINEINKMVSENKIQSAKGKLEGILYDDHNIKEVA